MGMGTGEGFLLQEGGDQDGDWQCGCGIPGRGKSTSESPKVQNCMAGTYFSKGEGNVRLGGELRGQLSGPSYLGEGTEGGSCSPETSSCPSRLCTNTS